MIQTYLQKFTSLSPDGSNDWPEASKGKAPYKPILLFCILDAIEDGTATENFFRLDERLLQRFEPYWDRIAGDRKSNPAMPFFYLRSQSFWHLLDHEGNVLPDPSLSSVTVPGFRRHFRGATLDEELYGLLQKEETRNLFRRTLLQTYFTAEGREAMREESRVGVEATRYASELIEGLTEDVPSPEKKTQSVAVRRRGFRHAVVDYAYDYQCAFCEIKIQTPEDHTVIEAAHIIPWSQSMDDDPRNGIGLCRLCHWIFDEGLIGVDASYRILFSDSLTSPENVLNQVGELEGKVIALPEQPVLYPHRNHLEWHRENTFRSV